MLTHTIFGSGGAKNSNPKAEIMVMKKKAIAKIENTLII